RSNCRTANQGSRSAGLRITRAIHPCSYYHGPDREAVTRYSNQEAIKPRAQHEASFSDNYRTAPRRRRTANETRGGKSVAAGSEEIVGSGSHENPHVGSRAEESRA